MQIYLYNITTQSVKTTGGWKENDEWNSRGLAEDIQSVLAKDEIITTSRHFPTKKLQDKFLNKEKKNHKFLSSAIDGIIGCNMTPPKTA